MGGLADIHRRQWCKLSRGCRYQDGEEAVLERSSTAFITANPAPLISFIIFCLLCHYIDGALQGIVQACILTKFQCELRESVHEVS